jgi:hypothetical protein
MKFWLHSTYVCRGPLNALPEFAGVLVLALECRRLQVHFQILQFLQRLKRIAVPQKEGRPSLVWPPTVLMQWPAFNMSVTC